MFDYRIREIADPKARKAELTLNGKTIGTPAHFPTLTRTSDTEKILDTFRRLNEEDEPLLPHTGGFVVESQNVHSILDGFEQPVQRVLGGNNLNSFKTLLDDLNRVLFVEPNTDRLLYWNYRQELDSIEEYLPAVFGETARRLDLDENDPDHLEFETAFTDLIDDISLDQLAEGFVDLQLEFGADMIFAPYFPIELDSYEDRVETNKELFRLTSGMVDHEVAPVMPLKTSVLGADAENEEGRIRRPDEWIDIIQSYRELDPAILFLKATNSRTDPDTLHKTDSEGIFQFFKLLRRFTNKPAFFLGIDEFAYILMKEGLDGYSHPIYDNPYRMPITNGNKSANHSYHRKFLVPREWGWEKFDQLPDLGCNCPFCSDYQDTTPSEIDFGDQDDLRKSHWLWLRDEELDEIAEAIGDDHVRPGLQSICSDSEWKKNFTTFL